MVFTLTHPALILHRSPPIYEEFYPLRMRVLQSQTRPRLPIEPLFTLTILPPSVPRISIDLPLRYLDPKSSEYENKTDIDTDIQIIFVSIYRQLSAILFLEKFLANLCSSNSSKYHLSLIFSTTWQNLAANRPINPL